MFCDVINPQVLAVNYGRQFCKMWIV